MTDRSQTVFNGLPSRRSVLRGSAVAIALPWLESLARPRLGWAADAIPQRLVAWHVPNGAIRSGWLPTAVGPNYQLSATLAPLAKVKSKLLVLTGLQNEASHRIDGSHACGPAGMLTCVLGKRESISVGVSVDQVFANSLGEATRISSLQLGITDRAFADVGHPAAYNATISYKSATQPLRPTIDPQVVFDQLVADTSAGSDTAQATKTRALRMSVLDHVRGEANDLHRKLGKTDRLKLDEYLTGIRDVERKLEGAAGASPSCGDPGPRPPSKPQSIPQHVEIMSDLTVLALRCDATRVVSFMLGNAGNSGFLSFPWLSINNDHHGLSHHQNRADAIAKLLKIELWEMQMFAYLLEKMDAVKESDGKSLLDHSAVFLSSELGDGNAHDQKNKPILIAGSAGGALNTGTHLKFNNEPQGDLFVALLQALGVPTATFGRDGKRPLPGVVA